MKILQYLHKHTDPHPSSKYLPLPATYISQGWYSCWKHLWEELAGKSRTVSLVGVTISSVDWNLRPRNFSFKRGKRKESHDAKSGKYGGYDTTTTYIILIPLGQVQTNVPGRCNSGQFSLLQRFHYLVCLIFGRTSLSPVAQTVIFSNSNALIELLFKNRDRSSAYATTSSWNKKRTVEMDNLWMNCQFKYFTHFSTWKQFSTSIRFTVHHGRLAKWIKWRTCGVGEAKEGEESMT